MRKAEAGLRTALSVLRDSVEAGKMPSGLPLEPDAREMHDQAIELLERLLVVLLRGADKEGKDQ